MSAVSGASAPPAQAVALLAEDAAARAFYVPISYGTVSVWQGKKTGAVPGTESMHRWTVYVRSADGRDLSRVVDRVIFTLHPTFAQPRRELTAPPFAVTEMGWGAFDIGIAIYLRDGSPVHLVCVYLLHASRRCTRFDCQCLSSLLVTFPSSQAPAEALPHGRLAALARASCNRRSLR